MKNLKKVCYVAVATLMFILHFGCKKEHDPTDNRRGQVVGTVTDANGEPISGMKISLSGINEEDQVTTSGKDGKYSFDNVTYRTHAVKVEKDGWLAVGLTVTVNEFDDNGGAASNVEMVSAVVGYVET